MKRVLAIWLPNWPVQRLVRAKPELAGRAVVLQGPSQRGEAVVACSTAAQRAGVEADMPVAEAIALLSSHWSSSGSLPSAGRGGEGGCSVYPLLTPSPQGGGERNFFLHDPAKDREALVELAQWCHRFSPSVGLEEGEGPETLLLDVTNLAPLFGSEAALAGQVAQGMRRRGFEARIALADTVGAAWGMARYDDRETESAVEPSEGRDLPMAALRLPGGIQVTLRELGLTTVAAVLALPLEELRSRFGTLLLRRIHQFVGTTPEVIATVDPPEEFVVEQQFEYPLTQGEAIRASVERLLERLAWQLAARNAGALAVTCRFPCEGAPDTAFEFGLFQPTANAQHLWELAELQLERVRLSAPATAIEVRTTRHATLEQRQGALFGEEQSLTRSCPLASLVNRLSGRLGRDAVVRCRLVSDAQPELAYREEPLVSGGGVGGSREKTRRLKPSRQPPAESGVLDRPLRLLARPAPLEMSSVFPEGPLIRFFYGGQVHQIAREWSVERIETGWWRRKRVARDYYRVETSEGRRFWLFQQLNGGRWFLHGAYE
jgi:protein ImuB